MNPMLTGSASIAWSMRAMFQGPGVEVVALVPVAGPVPPPSSVVMPLAMASSTCCGQIMWMWVSIPPGVTIIRSPAITSVPVPTTRRGSTPSRMSGLPALPIPAIRPSLMPMSALTMPQWSTIRALVMTRSRGWSSQADCPIPSRMTLPPPKAISSP